MPMATITIATIIRGIIFYSEGAKLGFNFVRVSPRPLIVREHEHADRRVADLFDKKWPPRGVFGDGDLSQRMPKCVFQMHR